MQASTKIFSRNLKLLLKVKNLNAKQFAQALETNEERVGHWLTGKCYPKWSMMCKICELYECFDIYKWVTDERYFLKTGLELEMKVEVERQKVYNNLHAIKA